MLGARLLRWTRPDKAGRSVNLQSRWFMAQSAPLLTSSSSVLWLKVLLSVATLLLLYLRYRKRAASGDSATPYSLRAKALVGLAVVLSFAAFHSFGKPQGGTFVHHGEMFHYYLGSKYFNELGYYELYNAVIAADAEQDSALAALPFYTDLATYQNAPRVAALAQAERVKGRFSETRWNAFKHDVSYFKELTGLPRTRLQRESRIHKLAQRADKHRPSHATSAAGIARCVAGGRDGSGRVWHVWSGNGGLVFGLLLREYPE